MPKKLVAFVPIKLNSQRLPGKNLKLLGSSPLFRYVLDTLIQVESIDEVYVFCSDESITEQLPDQVTFLKRDETLDSDETLGAEIYDAFIEQIDSDYYLLAHATSPFVSPETISVAVAEVLSKRFDSAFTAEEVRNFVWYEGRPLNYSLDFIPRTQDIEPVYVECSAFFIFSGNQWKRKRTRIGESPYMAIISGKEAIDIDDQEDFSLAEFYLERRV